MVFPSADESSEVVHPGEEPFYFPSFAIASKLASILGSVFSSSPVGAISSMPYSEASFSSSGSESYTLSPISRAGSWSRKLPARTSSTSRHSTGEALSTDTARGRLLSAAIAMILVPLPRRVGPTAKPPFWRSRRLHPRTPHPDSTCLVHADALPEASAPLPVFRFAPTAEICDDRSGTGDTSPATRAIAHPCQAPRTPHSTPTACHATDDHGYPPGAPRATPARQPTTVLRLTPNGLPSELAEKLRAPTE
jgi:hypothetical protein